MKTFTNRTTGLSVGARAPTENRQSNFLYPWLRCEWANWLCGPTEEMPHQTG